jgi:hypothetical protein
MGNNLVLQTRKVNIVETQLNVKYVLLEKMITIDTKLQ